MIYIYTMEYNSTRKKKILPFATTWMDPEGIMLSEISQRKTNTVWYHLYVNLKKPYLQKQRDNGGYQGLRGRQNGEMLVKGHKLAVGR